MTILVTNANVDSPLSVSALVWIYPCLAPSLCLNPLLSHANRVNPDLHLWLGIRSLHDPATPPHRNRNLTRPDAAGHRLTEARALMDGGSRLDELFTMHRRVFFRPPEAVFNLF